jgi:tRNA(fMet)-specific endonuclease VapC
MGNPICLDTDILIDLLRNKKEVVEWIKENEDNYLGTTIINIFELYYGAYKSINFKENIAAVNNLKDSLKIINFSKEAAEKAGNICNKLEKEGKAIDKRDLFIGVISLTEGFTLKTNNIKHFSRIEGLKII